MMLSGCAERSHSCLCTRNGVLALTWKVSSVGLWPYCHILGKVGGCPEALGGVRFPQLAAVGL